MRRVGMAVALVGMVLATSGAQDLRKTAAARAACGPPETTFDVDALRSPVLPAAAPGEALVYLIEQESATPALCFGRCGGLTLKVGMDGQWVGAVNGSSYMVTAVEPGEHHLCATWQSHVKKLSEKVALHGFMAEAGRTYYFVTHDVATSPEAGSMANITLGAADPDEARMLIEGYPQVKATPKR